MTSTPRPLGAICRGAVPGTLRDAPDWGIAIGDWLWAARVRILFVIDGPVNLGAGEMDFGLHQVLDTLRDPTFAWWVRFDIDVGKRDGEPIARRIRDHRDRFGVDYDIEWTYYEGFRLDQDGFDLNAYDQVWFFGVYGGDRDSAIADDRNLPLDDAELRLLAEWMDRGGGVFATGDHATLGASMSWRIPRVRTMRKWTHAQGVPEQSDATRHETLIHAPDGGNYEADHWPQTIEPVYRYLAGGTDLHPFPFLHPIKSRVPHPILCAPDGVIDTFPDHMHEGEVIEDGDVELDRPLDIPGYDGVEYPHADGIVAAAVPSPATGGIHRPHPQVIAYGRTTNAEQTASKRFALVGVYDGDRARIGRVVVDSTWHHWFSYNLVGFQQTNPLAYRRMQAYFRNVALWLARAEQRSSMLVAGGWGVLTGLSPMMFTRRMGPWEIGERVVEVLGQTMSPCILSEVVTTFLSADVAAVTSVPGDPGVGEPHWAALPPALVNRAIVGGIGAGLLHRAIGYKEAHAALRRPRLEPGGIRDDAREGAAAGARLLTSAIQQARRDFDAHYERLSRAYSSQAPHPIPVPVEVVAVRLVAERLQFPDPADPALVDTPVTLTIRLRLNDSVVAAIVVDGIETASIGPRGSLFELDRQATAIEKTGERLTIDVLAGRWGFERADPECIRFTDTLQTEQTSWLGSHSPGAKQCWRLWYRIETIDEPPLG
jgi:hypothetical protein